MCGIVGYSGKEGSDFLVEGLRRLEYRGYDSAGIATNANQISVKKGTGTIDEAIEDVPEGEAGIGHCLHPETLIIDQNGKVCEIQNLKSGKVRSFDFDSYSAKNKKYSKYSHKSPSKLFRIKGPYSDFKATPQHKLFVAENGEIKEKEVKNLDGEELIAVPSKIPHNVRQRPSFSDIEQTRKYKDLEFPAEPSKELLKIVGYHIGDGFISGNRTLRYKDQRKEILKSYKDLFEEVFNISGNIHERKEGKHYVLNVNSKYLVDWFIKNIPQALESTGEEQIPELVYNCKLNEIGGFISGIFDAEGTVGEKSRQVSLTMTCERFVKELRIMLLKKEVLSTIYEEKRDKENWSNAYTLSLNSEHSISNFCEWAGFTAQDKADLTSSLISEMDGRTYKHSSVPDKQESIDLDFSIGSKKSLITDKRLKNVLNEKNNRRLRKKLDSKIVWTRFEITEEKADTERVFDLEVEDTKSFFGGGAVQHNSRWATHGGVTDENAHPHTCCKNEVAVVHNGIIQNHQELKKDLDDHEFKSDTDTEVIPHLIEEMSTNSYQEIAENLKNRLEGSYAVVVLFANGDIMALRQGSPLAIGIGEDEHFLGSDVTAFLDKTEQAVFLEDGDHAIIRDGLEINGEKEFETREIEWDAEEASKKGYEHFMLKEIEEQPKTVKRAAFQDRKDMEAAKKMIENANRIVLTGCGTSGYAAQLGAKFLRDSGIEVEYEQSHELEYRSDEFSEDDLVIALSQSGETADLLSFLDEIDSEILSVVNVIGSTLDRRSGQSLYANAGPEIGVASTKAFTAQITVLKLLGYTLDGELEDGRESLLDTAEKIEDVIKQNQVEIDQISEYLLDKEHTYFIGRDKGVELAKESALKLKELSYIHAEAFPGGEFKHGTLALVEDGTPLFGFLKNQGYDEMVSNISEAKSRGADIVGVGSEPIDSFEFFIQVPEDDNREILEVVPFQLLAYKTSVKLGNNPDKPRNLAKSVTVK